MLWSQMQPLLASSVAMPGVVVYVAAHTSRLADGHHRSGVSGRVDRSAVRAGQGSLRSELFLYLSVARCQWKMRAADTCTFLLVDAYCN